MEDLNEERSQIISASLDARLKEVMHYQINIDNYSMALAMIGEMEPGEQAELAGFVEQLKGLLASSILEQKKAKVMLAVIERQVK